jgi:hypothetical protein
LNNSASATTLITLIWISSSAKLMVISKRQDALKTNGIVKLKTHKNSVSFLL